MSRTTRGSPCAEAGTAITTAALAATKTRSNFLRSREVERSFRMRALTARRGGSTAICTLYAEVLPEPSFECGPRRRPFMVEHREPGAVAVTAFDNHVLAEDTLEAEAELERRSPRSLI